MGTQDKTSIFNRPDVQLQLVETAENLELDLGAAMGVHYAYAGRHEVQVTTSSPVRPMEWADYRRLHGAIQDAKAEGRHLVERPKLPQWAEHVLHLEVERWSRGPGLRARRLPPGRLTMVLRATQVVQVEGRHVPPPNAPLIRKYVYDGKEYTHFDVPAEGFTDSAQKALWECGWSWCSPKDQFGKKRGRQDAIERMRECSIGLVRRIQQPPVFEMLEEVYLRHGPNWLGRGEERFAALFHMANEVEEWRAELGKNRREAEKRWRAGLAVRR